MWPSALKQEWKKCCNFKDGDISYQFVGIGHEMVNAAVRTIDSGRTTTNRLKLTFPFQENYIEAYTRLVDKEKEKLLKILRGEETYVEENLVNFFTFNFFLNFLDTSTPRALFSELFSARKMETVCPSLFCQNAFSDGQNFCHAGMHIEMYDELYHRIFAF